MSAILMIHGVGSSADAFVKLAPAFRERGWRVETPTLRPDKRPHENPPADLPKVSLADYIADMEAAARALEAETGAAPVLVGHSMGGLVVQKLLEKGVGRAGVLITPASPADARGGRALAQGITFANIMLAAKPETKAHRIWRFGFSWGVMNCVPRSRHDALWKGNLYDSGQVYSELAYPERDPKRLAFVDERKIKVPLLVIGAGKDRTTPIGDVRKVAAKYAKVGAEYREYANNAHWIVDEPGTDKVIADIADWMSAKGLSPKAAVPAAAPAKPKAAKKPAAPRKAAAAAAPAPVVTPPAPKKAPAKKAAPAKPAAAPKGVKPKAAAKPAPAAPKPKIAAKPAAKTAAPAKAAAKAKPAVKAAPAKAPAKAKPVARPAPAKAAAPKKAAPAPVKPKAAAAKAPAKAKAAPKAAAPAPKAKVAPAPKAKAAKPKAPAKKK